MSAPRNIHIKFTAKVARSENNFNYNNILFGLLQLNKTIIYYGKLTEQVIKSIIVKTNIKGLVT